MSSTELRLKQEQALEHFLSQSEGKFESEEEFYCSIPRHAVQFLKGTRQLRYWQIRTAAKESGRIFLLRNTKKLF